MHCRSCGKMRSFTLIAEDGRCGLCHAKVPSAPETAADNASYWCECRACHAHYAVAEPALLKQRAKVRAAQSTAVLSSTCARRALLLLLLLLSTMIFVLCPPTPPVPLLPRVGPLVIQAQEGVDAGYAYAVVQALPQRLHLREPTSLGPAGGACVTSAPPQRSKGRRNFCCRVAGRLLLRGPSGSARPALSMVSKRL